MTSYVAMVCNILLTIAKVRYFETANRCSIWLVILETLLP